MKITKDDLHPDLRKNFWFTSRVPNFVGLKWLVKSANYIMTKTMDGRKIDGLGCEEAHVKGSEDGNDIRVRIYRPLDQKGDLPVMLFIHGGGYVTGKPEQFDWFIKRIIETRPCVVIAPDYRKAHTKPFPAGLNDCYDTLIWARDNAKALRIDRSKLMTAGHSAGGGLTAAMSLKLRDTKALDISFQMPIYPMIDDQQPNDPARDLDAPIWNTRSNRAGWNAYLADLHKSRAEIPAYAAAARCKHHKNLPPTITFVGTVEPFYQETKTYVHALREAEVDVIYTEFEGCFHGFDIGMPQTGISQTALEFTFNSFAKFFDKYIG